jgi:ABC-type uncharacterized transport system involved in gliding motility auxiliary subunit
MKTDPRRFAPLGLVLSLIAVIAFVITLLIKGFASTGLYTPPDPDLLNRLLWICTGVFVLGIALFALLDPERTRAFLTGRQAQYGSNSLIMFLAFIGILIVINVIVYQNPKRWDLTESKEHTLAPETVNTLKALPQPVQATAFYSAQLGTTQARQLLDDYKQNSNGKFSFEFVDPDLNPVQAQLAGITGDGKILLKMGTRNEIVASATEQDITTSLVKLINPQSSVIYFLVGHGERDTQQTGDTAYTDARQTLENKNYTIKTLNLRAENIIPDDAKVIVIDGPVQPISEQEANLLDAYLNKGGSVVLLEEAPVKSPDNTTDPFLELLSQKWGVKFGNDLVIDPSANPPLVAIANQYGKHAITGKMNNIITLYPTARSIDISGVPSDVTATGLVYTIDRAWGETNFDELNNNQVKYDQGADIAGPVLLAAALSNTKTSARIVVFGDADFAQDSLFNQYGNGDMFINAVDWAAQQENIISLTPKQPIDRQYTPPGTFSLVLILIGTVCLLPLLIVAGGVGAWWTRRRRG